MKNFYIVLFLLFSSFTYSQNPCPGLDSINYSGQWYHTVQIGSQCWLKENLNVGNMIPAVKDQINNDTIEKFCYNNDPANCTIYGGLYQWREAMQYSLKVYARGICPIGWHIPSWYELYILMTAVNNDGNALKKIGQGGGTNTSGFSAFLAGYNDLTSFGNLGIVADLWTSNGFPDDAYHDNNLMADNMAIENDSYLYFQQTYYASSGLSIRCLKENVGLLLQSPYGGESWQVGTSHKISWGGANLSDSKIKIEFTTDNGTNWIKIIDSTPANDGEFTWTIPNTPSKNCRVKISDINIPDTMSISDTVFSINYDPCPPGNIVENGGKIYKTVAIGSTCWFKENVNIGTMIPGIQQATANGIIEKYCYNDDTANCTKFGGLYSYSETSEPGFCPTYWHFSGISAPIRNALYDGNALKEVGQGSGFGAGTNISGFSVLLAGYRSTDGTFNSLGNEVFFPSNPFTPVRSYADFIYSNNSHIDETDFWIMNYGSSYRCYRDEVGQLLLTSPKGGESWQVGTTQKITWSLCNVINIKIDYTTDNGTNWINIISSTPTSASSYSWTIPNTPSTRCKVKISSTNNSDTNSISNSFQIYQVPTNPCPGIPTVNYAGQSYNTIAIGDQCWLKENLNIGTMIDSAQTQTNNGIIEKYCYNNDTVKCSIYGGLYQWDEAMQYDSIERTKGICPTGWHMPTWNDLSLLKSSVNNNSNALKEIGQGTGSGAGTNSSGFSALLAGRSHFGSFTYLNVAGDWWTSTIYDETLAYNLQVSSSTNIIQGLPVDITLSYSIRCINDSSVSVLPVELTSFTASLNDNNVLLNWNTATEINFSLFDIEKKISNNNTWQKIASVKASGNSSSPKQYSFTDKNVSTGKYNYRLKMVDMDGSFKYSNIIAAEVTPPAKYELSNAYPNPWNPTTTIRYQLPINIFVTIKVFNSLGREIATLVNELKPTGSYEITFNGKGLASGIYYYQMKAGNFIETKKFVLMK